MSEKGRWDQALFDEYRAASPGPRKRALASRLIIVNEPLVKTLIAQLCRRAPPSFKNRAGRLGGCVGFERIEDDDALQAGRIALMKALDQYDPAGGSSFSYYLALKCRYEMQVLLGRDVYLVRTPESQIEHRPEVVVDSDHRALAVAPSLPQDEPLPDEEPEYRLRDIKAWAATSEWPAELRARWIKSLAAGLRDFFSRCRFLSTGRVETWRAYSAYVASARSHGEVELPRKEWLATLVPFGVTEGVHRIDGYPRHALKGLSLSHPGYNSALTSTVSFSGFPSF